VCRKIRITEDAVVSPQSRLTVAGLVLISSARAVNVRLAHKAQNGKPLGLNITQPSR